MEGIAEKKYTKQSFHQRWVVMYGLVYASTTNLVTSKILQSSIQLINDLQAFLVISRLYTSYTGLRLKF